MAKERNFNPVQAQRKAEKAKAIKKGKADIASKRNERLAQRNPERIRKQIEDLKAIKDGGGALSRHEEQVLEGLEKELKAVTKARDALGDSAPSFGHARRDGDGGVLGKRRRRDDVEDQSSSDSDVSDDVRNIPMPGDTPPPIAKEVLDKWYAKRRARRQNPNEVPLGLGRAMSGSAPGKAAAVAVAGGSKTVYEAKPVVRDLRKEAVSAFVPAAVRAKIDKGKGLGGRLLEPEEADQLEREGYLKKGPEADITHGLTRPGRGVELPARTATVEEVEEDD